MYFLKTTAGNFEEVNEYVYKNQKFAVNENQEPRYTGLSVTKLNGEIKISGPVTHNELGIIARLLAVSPPTGSSPNGFARTPEAVEFKKGNSHTLYHQATNKVWKQR